MAPTEPVTQAGRALLNVMVARYGGQALDPVSHELTREAILAIEAEAAQDVMALRKALGDLLELGYAPEHPTWAEAAAVLANTRALLDGK